MEIKGDTIKFGRYKHEQGNGIGPIEWEVLDDQNGKLLLISKDAIDCKEYHEGYEDRITWHKCDLRRWLNKDFLSEAFNDQERSMITTTHCYADKNPKSETSPGSATDDKVFLLSIPEANKYFSSDDERMCVPTEYAVSKEAYTSKKYLVDDKATCFWWLRSPGAEEDYAAYVNTDGAIDYNGIEAYDGEHCIRPALWVDFEHEQSLVDKECATDNLQNLQFLSATVGDTIKLGEYEQGEGVRPIEWRVLDRRADKILLISKNILDCKEYHNKYEEITWEECALRQWLNRDFFNEAFNESERKLISDTRCPADRNPESDANPGNETIDKIFVLSITEAEKYLRSDEDRMCSASDYAVPEGEYDAENYTEDGEDSFWWWLRSPGNSGTTAARVDDNGTIYYDGIDVDDDYNGVRPVLWLSLKL